MSSVKKVTTILDLDLSDIPRAERAVAKKEVGDFIINEILRFTERGASPVKGEGQFKKLTPEYAKEEKGGRRTANLRLDGDLVDAIKSKNRTGSKIEVGVEGKEAPKADGHNQISGEAKAWAQRTKRTKYKRRFIPDDNKNQKFSATITNGINSILDNFRVTDVRDSVEEIDIDTTPTSRTNTTTSDGTPTQTIEVNDLFSDDAIEALLLDALSRG